MKHRQCPEAKLRLAVRPALEVDRSVGAVPILHVANSKVVEQHQAAVLRYQGVHQGAKLGHRVFICLILAIWRAVPFNYKVAAG